MMLNTKIISLVLLVIFWILSCQFQEKNNAGLPITERKFSSPSNTHLKEQQSYTSALEMRCEEDSIIRLANDTSDSDRYVIYKLIDSIPYSAGYFVMRQFYEGMDWIFISKETCTLTPLFGPVLFNPSKSMFASVFNDNEAGYSANGVQIVSVEFGNTSIELQDKMGSYGGVQWFWVDDSTFSMKIMDLNGHQKNRTYSFREGTWLIKNE